jgi:CheY-like chemotaxis protein
MLARIFDIFTQVDQSIARSHDGLGIGLSVARRLVEMHDGRIEAFSEGPGKGSEFVVTIPAPEELPDREPAPVAESGSAEPTSMRVLVVDDNVDAAETMGHLLQHFGHAVHVIHESRLVADAVRSFHPRVVLLDIGLPGLDGYAVARQLRQEFGQEQIRLIALTGYGGNRDFARSREAGFDHHLVKPVDPEVLRKAVDESGRERVGS